MTGGKRIEGPSGKALYLGLERLGQFRDANRWDHYKYRFHYREPESGRTFSITWKCGMGYGDPQPLDGLSGAFIDADFLEHEYDMLDSREVRAIERTTDRLRTFLDDDYDAWREHCDQYERRLETA